MIDNQNVDYTENSFYRTFPQHSFASRIARWVKAFSYSFIALSIFSIILEHLQHYCITPPGMFFQFLFALLMAGIIEVICIQMSNVSDHTVLDYAKNLVTVIQHRFVLRKAIILASFEQVRVIGVSSRPPTLLGHLFADPHKRYALVIMNYRNHLIHITEYEMSLEDANELATELAARHMPSARFIMGEADTELVADALTGDVSTRPVRHSPAAMIDATILPALQAFCGLMITAALVSITMLAISRISTSVFDTDLLVAHQPVTQLFLRPVPRIDKNTGQNQPGDTGTASGTVALKETAPVASVTAALLPQAATATPAISGVATRPDAAPALIEPASESVAVETILYQASESVQVATPATADNSVTEPAVGPTGKTAPETAQSQSNQSNQTGLTPEDQQKDSATAVSNPDKAEIAMTPAATGIKHLPEPPTEPVRSIPDRIRQNWSGYQTEPVQTPRAMIPVNDSLEVKIPAVSAAALPQQTDGAGNNAMPGPVVVSAAVSAPVSEQTPEPVPATPARECSILAGFGLHPFINLGEIATDLESSLGKPLAKQKYSSGIQRIYNGFTILSDEHDKVVKQIVITRKTVNKDFVCQTPQNIGVGSTLELLRTHLGPPTVLAATPGLHFPGIGISFIPSPAMPDTIGAIKIYPAGTRPE